MRVCFPNEKISTTPNKHKNRKIKRDGILVDDKICCPLCFISDFVVVKTDFVRDLNALKHTAICNQCGIRIIYFRETPLLEKKGGFL